MSNIWKDGMLGLIVGDALGVPVEFMSRTELMKNPVTGMREYGTHHQGAHGLMTAVWHWQNWIVSERLEPSIIPI